MSDRPQEAAARALLLRCAASDSRALAQLYALVAPLLFGLLTRYLQQNLPAGAKGK